MIIEIIIVIVPLSAGPDARPRRWGEGGAAAGQVLCHNSIYIYIYTYTYHIERHIYHMYSNNNNNDSNTYSNSNRTHNNELAAHYCRGGGAGLAPAGRGI